MMMEGFRAGGDSGGVSVVNAEFKRLNLESSCNREFGRDPEFSKLQRMMVEGFRGDDVFGRNSEFNLGLQQGCEPYNDPSVIRVGWRVLIIDDPNPNSGLFKFSDVHHLFIDFGCIVHAITEPSTILSTLKQKKNMVDFVICNIHMKGLDEATLFELVGLKDVLVIMMSSYMDTRLVTEGMNHGASSFVLKPQTFDDIQNISSLLLEKKKYPSWFPLNLNRKFDQVVHQLGGLDKAVPEKIQELMNAVNIIPVPVIDKHLKIRRDLARLVALRRSEKDVPLPECLLRGSYRRPGGDSGGVSGVNAEFKRLNLESFGNREFGRDPEFSKKQRMMVEGFRGDDVFGRNSEFNLGIQQGCEPYNNPSVIRVGWRVLIIDDPNPNSGLFKFSDVHHLFINFGCIVHAITEPSRILSTLKQKKDMVDFVICNIHMKGLDEATLFELVGLKDVFVIMMSSYMDTRLVTEGMNHGASLFVLKPQTFDDIQNISSFLLERKKYPSKFPLNLNRKFDQAVVQLGGLDEAVPEKIQELMNAENIIPVPVIAAHLKITCHGRTQNV